MCPRTQGKHDRPTGSHNAFLWRATPFWREIPRGRRDFPEEASLSRSLSSQGFLDHKRRFRGCQQRAIRSFPSFSWFDVAGTATTSPKMANRTTSNWRDARRRVRRSADGPSIMVHGHDSAWPSKVPATTARGPPKFRPRQRVALQNFGHDSAWPSKITATRSRNLPGQTMDFAPSNAYWQLVVLLLKCWKRAPPLQKAVHSQPKTPSPLLRM